MKIIPSLDLPLGWQRCDGTVIEHPSPWSGKLTPDLNNEKRFLRGGHDSDQLRLEDDSMKSHSHSTQDIYLELYGCPSDTSTIDSYSIDTSTGPADDHHCQRNEASGSFGDGETKPKNMNVIFIIRVFEDEAKSVKIFHPGINQQVGATNFM